MECPRCETVPLDERERDGIVVDACSKCRGSWLDRGELEKLIARAMHEYEEHAPPPAPRYEERRVQHDAPPRRDRGYERDYGRRKRKRSWFEMLEDVFD